MENSWLMYVWIADLIHLWPHNEPTHRPSHRFSFCDGSDGGACVRTVQIAATMAGPSKAAKIEYIMKPKVLAFALVLFLALLLSPIMGEANARAHRCIGMS